MMIVVFLVVWLVLCTECTEAVANNRESESCSCSCLNDQLMELLQGYHNDTVSILNDYLKCRDLHEEELLRRKHIGENLKYPAYSCHEVADRKPLAQSGYYWLQTCRLSTPVKVYCDLEKTLDDTRGWMRVTVLDMRDSQQQCPDGLKYFSSPKRACGRSVNGLACNSVTFTTYGLQYQKVCGRLLGYQVGHPDAFYRSPSRNSIEESYVDGVSITHGKNPRKHIWTYAIGLTESNLGHPQCNCPCNSPNPGLPSPAFVGSDYHCESGLYIAPLNTDGAMYADDVMWDGKRCDGDEGPCCNKTGLPWFCKELSQPTTDDLEVRFCGDEGSDIENAAVEFMDLYIGQ